MQIQTILNRVQKHQSFVYGKVQFVKVKGQEALVVDVAPRANGQATCSGCVQKRPGYDCIATPRLFEFVPLFGFQFFFCYAMRRVDCPKCGVVVEAVPWAEGKNHLTTTYMWFLAKWARRLSWKGTAEAFRTTWDNVFRCVKMAVDWGRKRVDLEGVTAIGVDEIAWQYGHKYLTLVYQIDEHRRRLLWIGKDRTVKTFLRFFQWFRKERSALLKFVCSDMWKPYLRVIAKKAAGALHVLDRFHIMSHMGKALDEVRAGEARDLKAKGGEPILKHSRWCILKRPENLTEKQGGKLLDLLRLNLKTVRAYLLKENFQLFWDYLSPHWAGLFLDRWCNQVMRSRIEPLKEKARMLRNHRTLLMNWFRARGAISNGVVEGFNNKAKLTMRKAYGFRSYEVIEVALYHVLGDLPEPKFTHEFC